MADAALSFPSEDDAVGSRICTQVIKILFELWVRNPPNDLSLWRALFHLFQRRINHVSLITQWTTVTLALSMRLCRILFGPTEGSDLINLASIDVVHIDVPDDQVLHLYYRFLQTLANPNVITDTRVHAIAITGVAALSDHMTSVGRRLPASQRGKAPPQTPNPPDGNSVLELFGEWLFGCIEKKTSDFIDGINVAYGALCRIFSACTGVPFHAFHLSRFYFIVSNVLQQSSSHSIVEEIFMNSQYLFGMDHPGLRALMPVFLEQCKTILLTAGMSDALKRAALTIAGSVMCMVGHFASVEYSKHIKTKDLNFKSDPVEILLKFVQFEKNQELLEKAFWCLYVYVVDSMDQSPTLSFTVIKTLLRFLSSSTSTVVRNAVFEVLSEFSRHNAIIHKANPTTIPSVVRELCIFAQMQAKVFSETDVSVQVSSALYCLLDWLMHCDWLFGDQEILNSVLDVVEICRGMASALPQPPPAADSQKDQQGRNSANSASGILRRSVKAPNAPNQSPVPEEKPIESNPNVERVREAAQCVFTHMMVHMSNYPVSAATSNVSALFSEESELALTWSADALDKAAVSAVRHFILDDAAMISLSEKPSMGAAGQFAVNNLLTIEGGSTLILRDQSGKFAWDSQIKFDPSTLPPQSLISKMSLSLDVDDAGAPEQAREADAFAEVLKKRSTLDSSDIPPDGSSWSTTPTFPEPSMREVWRNCIDAQALEQGVPHDPQVVRTSLEVQKTMPDVAAPTLLRSQLLASHLGILSLDLYSKVAPLEQGVKLTRSINSLDKTHERECHKIGVIYVKKGQQTQRLLFRNEGGSPHYEAFLSSLGWPVDLGNHPGFMGGLDPNLTTGRYAPFYATYNLECIFHVPTMMPNNLKDAQQIHKKRHVGNDHVHIVWNEHLYDYRPNTITSQFNHVHIILNPMPCGMVRVIVSTKEGEKIAPFGPLQDGMIIPLSLVGPLSRHTAINANRRVRYKQEGYRRPYPTRKTLLSEICGRHKQICTPSEQLAFVGKT